MNTDKHGCRFAQPEGLPEISRGLSAATPPVIRATVMHPGGVPESSSLPDAFCDPSGVVFHLRTLPGVSSRSALLNPRLISGTALRCFDSRSFVSIRGFNPFIA